jgi:hypothetical protein
MPRRIRSNMFCHAVPVFRAVSVCLLRHILRSPVSTCRESKRYCRQASSIGVIKCYGSQPRCIGEKASGKSLKNRCKAAWRSTRALRADKFSRARNDISP